MILFDWVVIGLFVTICTLVIALGTSMEVLFQSTLIGESVTTDEFTKLKTRGEQHEIQINR